MAPDQTVTTRRSETESEQSPDAEPMFQFLRLPRELRDNIYEHFDASVAGEPTRVIYKECMNCNVKEKERRGALAKSSYAVLAHICRQIRHEYLRVRREHAHVSIHYGDLEHWFDNCKVDGDNIWHVRHVHIPVSQNDDMIRKEVSILSLLQYQARHPTTFNCDFQHLDELNRDISWSSSTSFWTDGLTSSEVPWRHNRKKVIDINTLMAYRDEGWLKVLREDPAILKDVTLVAHDHLTIKLESHFKLDVTVVERLFRAFELERNNYRHLPESRLTGPVFFLKHPQYGQKFMLRES